MIRILYKGGKEVAEIHDGVVVWSDPSWEGNEPISRGPMIQPDIKPYQSMIDGSYIGSRSKHRAHLKNHGCIEVGNETKYLKSKPLEAPSGLKETLIQVANEKLRS